MYAGGVSEGRVEKCVVFCGVTRRGHPISTPISTQVRQNFWRDPCPRFVCSPHGPLPVGVYPVPLIRPFLTVWSTFCGNLRKLTRTSSVFRGGGSPVHSYLAALPVDSAGFAAMDPDDVALSFKHVGISSLLPPRPLFPAFSHGIAHCRRDLLTH